jgi:hypothetical protein
LNSLPQVLKALVPEGEIESSPELSKPLSTSFSVSAGDISSPACSLHASYKTGAEGTTISQVYWVGFFLSFIYLFFNLADMLLNNTAGVNPSALNLVLSFTMAEGVDMFSLGEISGR